MNRRNRSLKMFCGNSFILVAMAIASTAEGGVEHGNGGDVVVCHYLPGDVGPDTVTSITQLDFFEGLQLRHLTPSLGEDALDPVEKAKIAFERLRTYDAKRADFYIQRATEFMARTNFINAVIPDIPDQGGVLLPENCSIVQIARHDVPQFPLDKEFIIRRDLWQDSHFDSTQKAGLIIHEIIYADAVTRGHINSINARYFSQYLASASFLNLSPDEYQTLMLDTMMDEFDDFVEYGFPVANKLLRFFATRKLSYSDANAFCENINFGSSTLSRIGFDLWTHIAKGILGPNLDGSTEFWQKSPASGGFVPAFFFDRRGITNSSNLDWNKPLSFGCELDVSHLKEAL